MELFRDEIVGLVLSDLSIRAMGRRVGGGWVAGDVCVGRWMDE